MRGKELSKQLDTCLAKNLAGQYDGCWENDGKGVIYGWFRLSDKQAIVPVAEIIAGLGGRVMAITAMAPGDDRAEGELLYHFAIGFINCTFSVLFNDQHREMPSITPVLKSADWHEREIQELYDIQVRNHPNPRPLFIDAGRQTGRALMVPLSEAMDNSCTTRLWERIIQSKDGGAEK